MANNENSASVRVQRFNPDLDEKPYFDTFQVSLADEPTLLDALQWIKTTLDGSVTFRKSCRHAICGSCAMNVNGRNLLVCHQPLRKHLNRKGRGDDTAVTLSAHHQRPGGGSYRFLGAVFAGENRGWYRHQTYRKKSFA
ncbi:MAG: 2Fe-2S iron-sulfur cluster-binding protein [Chloroflexi bacterium]|nr:2Fe-2S iron-sulfur cluster-binding protein [Chloroflexota bacterium]